MMKYIPLADPLFSGNEIKYLTDCIKSTWVSSGKYVDAFEKQFAKYCGAKYACTVASGTAALHISAIALNIKPGDEVIIPDLTYVSVANILMYIGAIPVKVDVEKDTWAIDPTKIEEKITKNTKAIIVVHLYGNPAKMDKINAIAKKYKLKVIEDACEALGATYKGKHVGGLSDFGCFSFSGNKVVTTGEGGMIITNNTSLMKKVRAIKANFNDSNRHFFHTAIGYPYRYSNLEAAVGLAQLESIEKFKKIKIKNAKLYSEFLKDESSIILTDHAPLGVNTYWLYCIVLKKVGLRDKLMRYLQENNIQTRPVFPAMHVLPMYKDKEKFPNADFISKNGVCLPSGLTLTPAEIEYVCIAVKKFLNKYD